MEVKDHGGKPCHFYYFTEVEIEAGKAPPVSTETVFGKKGWH